VTLMPPLAVGDDGAYYLVQVRAILRGGALAIPDFPLLFYVQAGVARLLSLVMEQRAAIIAAVRITDTFFPLMLAVPVFLFARAFQRPSDRPGQGAASVALVGLMAVLSGNILFMAGGMIKNAVALPFSFLCAFALYKWLYGGRLCTLAWAALWFVLASFTHMSGFVLSVVFAAGVLLVGVATPTVRPRVWLPGIVLLSCLAGCLAIVYALDPERAQRLIHAAVAPGWLFAGSPCWLWLRGFPDEAFRVLFESAEVWLGVALGVLGVFTLWRHRAEMDAPTRVLLVVSTFVTFALSLPLFRPDVNYRLALFAYVPGMIPAVYLVCRKATTVAVIAPLALVAMLHGALAVKTLRQTALVPAAHQELVHFRTALPQGESIVIVRPLLRWWVVWTLDTHFSTQVESTLAARNAYDAVLVLDEIRPGAFGIAPGPLGIGGLGAGVRDAALLRLEVVRTLVEGIYFRLSEVVAAPSQTRTPISQQ
ncbi:MAG: hypothetical protein MUC94_07140, partial [bacterium]|nr:hypothetical protein [bacterium]